MIELPRPPTIVQSILVAQDEIRVEQYIRQADGQWLMLEFLTRDAVVDLPSIGCTLKLGEVYDRIVFGEERRGTR